MDIGGTFTDTVALLPSGAIVAEKVPTTPDPVEGLINGIRRLGERYGLRPGDIGDVRHATTLGSNLVLERAGQEVALLVTEGFRDLIEIGRAVRHRMYDITMTKPRTLVPRSRVWEVRERVDPLGNVIAPLDTLEVRRIAREWRRLGVQSAAVSYLNAYAFADHERLTASILHEEYPELLVTIGSDLSREAREYERTNTAVVNAYVTPVLVGYLSRIEQRLAQDGIVAPIAVMQSSGGLATPGMAGQLAVRTLESGPAAGVLMSATIARRIGKDAVSFDMGGTTAKASTIINGTPAIVHELELDRSEMRRGSGLPILTPSCDLVEIGSGGGSIAHDDLGSLRVGPRSAGSDPGPACYGRGGDQPTVTDANVLLGYVDPDRFAGGMLELDKSAADRALGRLGSRLGMTSLEVAWAIHELATLQMEHAIRLVSIDRGLDPRDLALICLGGAGPIHGCRLARSLGMRTAIIPRAAGTGSAVGLLHADQSVEFSATRHARVRDEDLSAVMESIFSDLEERARAAAASLGAHDVVLQRALGVRHVGQGGELRLTIGSTEDAHSIEQAFRTRYRELFGSTLDHDVECATWYVQLSLTTKRTEPPMAPGPPLTRQPIRARNIFTPETGVVEVFPLWRDALAPGESVAGPTVIEEWHTATVLLPGDVAHLMDSGELKVEIG